MSEKIICQNRKARFNYEIIEKFEAGIVLAGSEVKSLREGDANLTDSYVGEEKGELWLYNAHIAHYKAANQFNHEPTQKRKLLMHRLEINRLSGKIREKGLTLIPLTLYFSKGKIKVELGLAKGKKAHDKRESIKRRETERDLSRVKKAMRGA